jgi:hypothetical protein
MDTHAARQVLLHELASWRSKRYEDLVKAIDQPHVVQTTGPDGQGYQVEIQVLWDGEPNDNLRVMRLIDDGGWRAIAPLIESFIITPSGDFIAESPSA